MHIFPTESGAFDDCGKIAQSSFCFDKIFAIGRAVPTPVGLSELCELSNGVRNDDINHIVMLLRIDCFTWNICVMDQGYSDFLALVYT